MRFYGIFLTWCKIYCLNKMSDKKLWSLWIILSFNSHRDTGGKRGPSRHLATGSHSLLSYVHPCILLLSATKKHQVKIKLFWGNRLQNYIWNWNNPNILGNKVHFYTQIQLHSGSLQDLKVQFGYKPCNYFMAWLKAFSLHLYPLPESGRLLYDVGFLERAHRKHAAALTDSIQQLTQSCLSIREHAIPTLSAFCEGAGDI